jgi:hypothetical protein
MITYFLTCYMFRPMLGHHQALVTSESCRKTFVTLAKLKTAGGLAVTVVVFWKCLGYNSGTSNFVNWSEP